MIIKIKKPRLIGSIIDHNLKSKQIKKKKKIKLNYKLKSLTLHYI